MKTDLPIPPLRDLPPGRLVERREHLLSEITSDRGSRGALTRVRWGTLSRRRLLALAAAALVVVVGTASALGVRAFFLDKGFIGLPPEGATPSSPDSGELVLSAYGLGHGARTRVWVYADGRVIAQQEVHARPEHPSDANKSSSGFLERRLSPNGVERVRSEALASGLFDRDRELSVEPAVPCLNFIHVRRDDRVVRVVWHGAQCGSDDSIPTATPKEASVLETLVSRLTNPAEWLPASAWEVRKVRAYVPSRYAVCFAEGGARIPIPSSYFLPLLPEAAQVLLREREFAPAPWGGPPCTDLTTEEARALSEALNAAGLEQFKGQRIDLSVLVYRLDVPGPIRGVIFEPYLPHGEITCSACG